MRRSRCASPTDGGVSNSGTGFRGARFRGNRFGGNRFRRSRPVSGAAYVGDRLRTDAIGAARAGLIGVWVNRTGATPDAVEAAEAEAAGVLEVHGLDELASLLVPRLTG